MYFVNFNDVFKAIHHNVYHSFVGHTEGTLAIPQLFTSCRIIDDAVTKGYLQLGPDKDVVLHVTIIYY
jgi:hypothetical protein